MNKNLNNHSFFPLPSLTQGWGAGVWLLGAGAARKKHGAGADWKKSQELEPGGAAKKLAGSSALLEDKNLKRIRKLYVCYSSLGKIVS